MLKRRSNAEGAEALDVDYSPFHHNAAAERQTSATEVDRNGAIVRSGLGDQMIVNSNADYNEIEEWINRRKEKHVRKKRVELLRRRKEEKIAARKLEKKEGKARGQLLQQKEKLSAATGQRAGIESRTLDEIADDGADELFPRKPARHGHFEDDDSDADAEPYENGENSDEDDIGETHRRNREEGSDGMDRSLSNEDFDVDEEFEGMDKGEDEFDDDAEGHMYEERLRLIAHGRGKSIDTHASKAAGAAAAVEAGKSGKEEDAEFDAEEDTVLDLYRAKQKRVWLSRIFSTNLYWSEKLQLLWDFAQLVAFWIAFPVPFPKLWLEDSSLVRAFLFDVPLDRTGVSSWYSFDPATSPSGPLYIFIFVLAGLPVLLAAVYAVLSRYKSRNMQRLVVSIMQCIYMPVIYHLAKMGVCQSDGGVLFTCQPQITGGAIPLLAVSIVIIVLFGIGFPFLMIHAIQKRLIYKSGPDHDAYIRAKEAEYILNLDRAYKKHNFYLFSSFKRHSVFFKPCMLLFKFLCIVVLCGFQSDMQWRAMTMCLLLAVPLLWCFFRPPFRCTSSSLCLEILGWCLFVPMLFGYLISTGAESPMLISTVVRVFVIFFLSAGPCAVALIILFRLLFERNTTWPVNASSVSQLTNGYEHFVAAIHHANKLLRRISETRPELQRCDLMSKMIRTLNEYWEQASYEEHPLANTLQFRMERLITEYNRYKNITLLPNRELEDIILEFKDRADTREKDLILMKPKKRSILMKLLALRAFQTAIKKRESIVADEEQGLVPHETDALLSDYQNNETGADDAPSERSAQFFAVSTIFGPDATVDEQHGADDEMPLITPDTSKSQPFLDFSQPAVPESSPDEFAGILDVDDFIIDEKTGKLASVDIGETTDQQSLDVGQGVTESLQVRTAARLAVILNKIPSEQLTKVKKTLNERLREFEQSFIAENGRKPKISDVKQVPEIYKLYKRFLVVRSTLKKKDVANDSGDNVQDGQRATEVPAPAAPAVDTAPAPALAITTDKMGSAEGVAAAEAPSPPVAAPGSRPTSARGSIHQLPARVTPLEDANAGEKTASASRSATPVLAVPDNLSVQSRPSSAKTPVGALVKSSRRPDSAANKRHVSFPAADTESSVPSSSSRSVTPVSPLTQTEASANSNPAAEKEAPPVSKSQPAIAEHDTTRAQGQPLSDISVAPTLDETKKKTDVTVEGLPAQVIRDSSAVLAPASTNVVTSPVAAVVQSAPVPEPVLAPTPAVVAAVDSQPAESQEAKQVSGREILLLSPEELVGFTKKLLQKFEAAKDDEEVQAEIGRVRERWKRIIYDWEKEFAKENGVKPDKDDKRKIKNWYVCFKLLTEATTKPS
eukprot:ANDGO_00730.mRNA.1 hypothetical protein PHYSODRAFT_318559